MRIEDSSVSWLKIMVLLTGAVSIALGWAAVMPYSNQVAKLAEFLPIFSTMEYNAALGFILCGLGLVSIGFGNRRLSMASGLAAVICLLVVYFGFVEPAPALEAGEQPHISEATLVVGFLMAFLPVLAVHFIHTAWVHAQQVKLANQELKNEITERKRAEDGLRQSREALVHSNKDLEQFAYVASHDLTEPLRMVASYVKLLEQRYKGKLDTDADEFIGQAVGGAKRIHLLINDLLAYSRVTTRAKPVVLTDSETVLNEVLGNLKGPIEESDAVVTHDPLPTVMADAVQLRQLFQNLIDNAIKFRGEQPPKIHISAQKNGEFQVSSFDSQVAKDDGLEISNLQSEIRNPHFEDGNPQSAIQNPQLSEWLFSVRDNAIGIDPQYNDRIFVIFQHLHTNGDFPGTGIGLAICKRIVERHGGRIWVESQPGKGATFHFTIPDHGGMPL